LILSRYPSTPLFRSQVVGEVHTPHHDRVGDPAQSYQVHHEPPGRIKERVYQCDDDGHGQPDDHGNVTHKPRATSIHGVLPPVPVATALFSTVLPITW